MTPPGQSYSWTQPVCAICWAELEPERRPVTVPNAPRERCCFCGADTTSGIYIRLDPRVVPFPAVKS